jgi:2,3-dihydroxybenzoate decarboxylase
MSLSRRTLVTRTPLATVAASTAAVAQATAPRAIPKVALEEHVITPPLMPYLEKAFPPTPRDAHDAIIRRLADFGDDRIATMDAAGVAISVLSISGPGVQIEPDARLATRLAAAQFIASAPLTDEARAAVASGDARALLKLPAA